MTGIKLRILIPSFLLVLSLSPMAYASEITGTLSAGGGNSVSGTVIGIPTASPPPGTYASAQSVTLTDPGSSSIRYTTDGTIPSCAGGGLLYAGSIAVPQTLTINAVACYPSGDSSNVGAYAYTISGGSLSGTVATSSSGSLSGTVTSSPGGSLTGTVVAPASGGSGGGGGGGGGGGNGPPASGGSGGGGSGPIASTGSGTSPGQVLGASTGPSVPGTPNTGSGGNAPENLFVILASAIVALGGFYATVRRSQMQ